MEDRLGAVADDSRGFSLQWGHDDGVVEEDGARDAGDGYRRFNGATTMESWKKQIGRKAASHRPRLQWGHDEGVVEDTILLEGIPAGRGFNGATTRSRGRLRRGRRVNKASELQWGHDDGVVEDLRSPKSVRPHHASMGPRRRSRGREFKSGDSAFFG